jgi:predicted transcriptional regulator
MSFQTRCFKWAVKCLSREVINNKSERGYRFIEESLELVQAVGMTKEQVLAVVDYTYSRPIGELSQEVGGVMVTLTVLCEVFGIDSFDEGERELTRIDTEKLIAVIRSKQQSKPKEIMG